MKKVLSILFAFVLIAMQSYSSTIEKPTKETTEFAAASNCYMPIVSQDENIMYDYLFVSNHVCDYDATILSRKQIVSPIFKFTQTNFKNYKHLGSKRYMGESKYHSQFIRC